MLHSPRPPRENIPALVRTRVLDEEPDCHYCGERDVDVMDHVVPASRGGESHRQNLANSCGWCNGQKGDRTPAEWKAWRLDHGYCWPPHSRIDRIARVLGGCELPLTFLALVRHGWPDQLLLAYDAWARRVHNGTPLEDQQERSEWFEAILAATAEALNDDEVDDVPDDTLADLVGDALAS